MSSRLFAVRFNLDDGLSPILVKELRQGLRSRVFMSAFLLIQLCMGLLVLATLAAAGTGGSDGSANGFFWGIISVALLFLMPLRGLGAISGELKQNTMETILITRMTSWRVVFGKWTALCVQSALVICAVLPYLVVRYFVGSNDLMDDLKMLLFFLWLSALLTASALALSSIGNLFFRVLLIGVAMWLFGAGATVLFSGISVGRLETGEILWTVLLFGFFIPAILFEVTLVDFAPVSENHAVRRRGLALLLLMIVAALQWSRQLTSEFLLCIPAAILIFICYFDLAEKPHLLARQIAPYRWGGWVGRGVALISQPGWPSAVLFSLVGIPLSVGLFYWSMAHTSGTWEWEKLYLVICGVLGSILVPVAICHLFLPRVKQILMVVVFFNIVTSVLLPILSSYQEQTSIKATSVLAFIPTITISLWTIDNHSLDGDQLGLFYVGNSMIVLLVMLWMLVGARQYYYRMWAQLSSKPDPVGSV